MSPKVVHEDLQDPTVVALAARLENVLAEEAKEKTVDRAASAALRR